MVELERVDTERSFLRLLINQLKPSVRASPNALIDLLDHIARMISGHAAVFTAEGRLIGRGNIPSILLQTCRSAAAERVRAGELGVASVVQGGFYLQIMGIGESKPRPVILVARRTRYPTWMADLVHCAAVALTASSALSRVERVERQLSHVSQTARTAVLMQLMVGNVEAAHRLADPAVAGALDTSLARVFVIEDPRRRRACILEACQRSLAGRALAAADPHRDDHVVVVAPAAQSPHMDEVRTVIKGLAATCTVGESGPVELDRIGIAHEMAVQALKVARRQPERIARYSGERQLAHLLADSARTWAQAYLKPLHELPDEEWSDVIAVLQQVLQSGHGAAAENIGINRKTVGARWNRAGSILGLDLRDMRTRAELNLALELMQTAADSPEPAPGLSLAEILLHSAARSWAEEFLAPLRRDGRPLLRTVTAWISVNGRIEECAEQLVAHPNTVRNHLGACERLLGRRLVGRAGGANDLVMALRITEQGTGDAPAQAGDLRLTARQAG